MSELTPREVVAELDRFIVGQADAKRAVAIAVRNRWRRSRKTRATCFTKGTSATAKRY